jgi:ribose transport system ATP-binding protein
MYGTQIAPAPGKAPRLALRALSKTFPGQMALIDADFELRRGEVHAVLGQNGSGKSTLIKILAGFHQADAGAEALLDGKTFELGSAGAAAAAGIRFVHQDLALVPELDAVDNLALGSRYDGRWWLSDRRERRATREILAEFGIHVDVGRPLTQLAPAERTMLAIARALREGDDRGTILVLDEPTATLGGEEAERLHALVRRIRDDGGSVLYVTHRLDEVFTLADRVTVLRDGRRVGTRTVAGLDHDGLVELIVGRPLRDIFPGAPPPPDEGTEVLLGATELCGQVIEGMSFDVFAGEILGIAGLIGSGREELPYLLTGARSWSSGEIRVAGRARSSLNPREAIAAGIGFVSSDRKGESALPLLSVGENITLPKLEVSGPLRWLSPRRERTRVMEWLRRLDIRPSAPDLPLASLSGGNQQKAVIARWLRTGTRVLVLDEPTQGVDIGAKAGIYQRLTDFVGAGNAAVVFSSDAEELASLCDRVIIVRDGRVGHVVDGEALAPEALNELLLRASRSNDPEVS